MAEYDHYLKRNGDCWAADPAWLPVVERCLENLSAKGIRDVPGVPAGQPWLTRAVRQSDNLVLWTLRWQMSDAGGKGLVIGRFVTDCIPPDAPRRCINRPVNTDGVVVTLRERDGQSRQVKVVLDGKGLPVPVPVEVYHALAMA